MLIIFIMVPVVVAYTTEMLDRFGCLVIGPEKGIDLCDVLVC